MSDPDPEPPERPRAVVALVLGLVAAVLLAAAAIVITRDLAGGGDPDPAESSVPTASTGAPGPSDWPGSPPPVNGCGPAKETPRGIPGQAAGRQLCHRFADRLRKGTDAMFECTIGDRVEACRKEADVAWATLSAIQDDPAYAEAKVILDAAFELAAEAGRRYRSPDCVGRNERANPRAPDCATSYSTFGVGLSALEYQLRAM